MRWAWLSLLGLGFTLGAGCSPKVGKECTLGKDVCADGTSVLHCAPGAKEPTYVSVKCGGPLGCVTVGGKATCDTSVADQGDPCLGSPDELACSPNKQRALTCQNGVFQRQFECRGPKGCTVAGRAFNCDNTLAELGEPCQRMGSLACAVDSKKRFKCKEGAWALDSHCRGREGCVIRLDDMFCDNSISELDDPCKVPNAVVCSADGTRRLVCKGGRFVEDSVCKGGCTVTSSHGIDCR